MIAPIIDVTNMDCISLLSNKYFNPNNTKKNRTEYKMFCFML